MSSKKTFIVTTACVSVAFLFALFTVTAARRAFASKRVAVVTTEAAPIAPPAHRSAKAMKAEAMANAATEKQCLALAETLASPYHKIEPWERETEANCYMLREKVKNPAGWQGALEAMDRDAR